MSRFLVSLLVLGAVLQGLVSNSDAAPPLLKVSPNGRYLVTDKGEPFFYLGDTAWELFHRCTREEAELYLKDRASKGFTVIQAVVLAELDGLHTPNPYGHVPLIDDDPTRPDIHPGSDNDYWDHVDWIVNRAEQLGLFIGMLPTWGDKWNKKWGVGPEIFTPENARIYGEFLGKRYRDKPIIWILGGDRNPENERHLAIIRAMAAGLRTGDQGNHLMTYHPQGGANSANWFHEDDWLAFNMFQSGHGRINNPNYLMTLANYERKPVKPTLDGEPRYEDHPVNWRAEQGWFDDWDVRQGAYWSMLSGACGHTYGSHNIWQMYEPPRKPVSAARTPWKKALHHPGSTQMGYMKQLFLLRPYYRLIPDQQLIAGQEKSEGEHRRAARAEDGTFAVIYLPTGGSIRVITARLKGQNLHVSWFDPRIGKVVRSETVRKEAEIPLAAPSAGRGNDWVLVLDSDQENLPPIRIGE
ncbi:MAG TPA: glycoside hydrolase family 140 protein [Thermogutta sp.]|nr:glycoside hydrolase family 140 protein [Thermogutta sp.]